MQRAKVQKAKTGEKTVQQPGKIAFEKITI